MKIRANSLGGGQCIPQYKSWSKGAVQKTLFDPMPRNQLEPAGNPAYEGYGFPAAGYGQTRRRVVKLALPKVVASPQLTSNGWEEKQPQLKTVTMFTLNENSDVAHRGEVAALAGLGCHCSELDRRFANNLSGLGAGMRGLGQDLTAVQQLANAIVTGVVPDSFLDALHDKLVADDKANALAYANIQRLKLIDPTNPRIAMLERAQQNSWGQTNTAKFYALLIPEMQSRLGFTSGSPHVTPPDYKYIKGSGDPGVFTKVADFLREKVVGEAAQQLIRQNYMKDTSGLAGLGIAPVVIGLGVALIIAAGVVAYMSSNTAAVTAANSRAAIVAACASGKLQQAACVAALEASKPNETDWGSVVKYGAIGVGALVLLQVISSIRSAFPGK